MPPTELLPGVSSEVTCRGWFGKCAQFWELLPLLQVILTSNIPSIVHF